MPVLMDPSACVQVTVVLPFPKLGTGVRFGLNDQATLIKAVPGIVIIVEATGLKAGGVIWI